MFRCGLRSCLGFVPVDFVILLSTMVSTLKILVVCICKFDASGASF